MVMLKKMIMLKDHGDGYRRARSIFIVYDVFQNLLRGAVIFFNLIMLFCHFIYIAQKLLIIKLNIMVLCSVQFF